MANYKRRVPEPWTGDIKVRVPEPWTGDYKVRVATTEQMTVDISAAPPGVTVSWVITPDPGGGNDSGSGTNATPPWVFQAPFDDSPGYTITWDDDDLGYEPPSPEGPIPLTFGNPITFALA